MARTTDPDGSFERAFDESAPLVFAYAVRRVGSPVVAQDVVAEAFLAAWRRWDRRPPVQVEILPWLYCFARNAVHNQRRSEVRYTRLIAKLAVQDAPNEAATDSAELVVGPEDLLAAIATMSETDQEVLLLVAWERVSDTRELAIALGTTAASARVRLYRARRRLRARLDQADDHDHGNEVPRSLKVSPTTGEGR